MSSAGNDGDRDACRAHARGRGRGCGAREHSARRGAGWPNGAVGSLKAECLDRDAWALGPVVVERPPHRGADKSFLPGVEARRQLAVVRVEDPRLLPLIPRGIGPMAVLENHDGLFWVSPMRLQEGI